ncbi:MULTISPECIES: sensor histidine kinase [Flavobacteriaceae]|uniref:sensor histidine kinase n=1 Tax=Flavobacteriaceae TaxID=49546 RepID=UPI0014919E06|nr:MULTISPECIES: HAMP domain-containing sensor histidine kinase [Allomuricauda]MDC6365788.1 HAMP domain-containing sensor histidine kinase [Muricauda sp. AC10]
METRKYKALLYIIVFTIVATIAIQVYWNVQNYKINKQRLVNEVQISLDNSVELYYANLAKSDFYAFLDDSIPPPPRPNHRFKIVRQDTVMEIKLDSLKQPIEFIAVSSEADSLRKRPRRSPVMTLFRKRMLDQQGSLKKLANRLIISATTDSINLIAMDGLLNHELARKNIELEHSLSYYRNDSLINSFNAQERLGFPLSTTSKSTYLTGFQDIKLSFSNPTLSILKRGLSGILLSFMLSLGVILCLFYLLSIIKKQKQLAEIKNDLISNITHEFKTPIATVSTALEGIKNFNDQKDVEKTEKYLDISTEQLQKLHLMVEKLLETATLDSQKLILTTESTDIIALLKNQIEQFKMVTDKNLTFSTNIEELHHDVDVFHFENVISNILDNAIKYGGHQIKVTLKSLTKGLEITIEDNGGGIAKSQREKIFDKFYRIPSGNQHDVKGFGIGLFYAQKIVEKHSGSLVLVPDTQNTIFKIRL